MPDSEPINRGDILGKMKRFVHLGRGSSSGSKKPQQVPSETINLAEPKGEMELSPESVREKMIEVMSELKKNREEMRVMSIGSDPDDPNKSFEIFINPIFSEKGRSYKDGGDNDFIIATPEGFFAIRYFTIRPKWHLSDRYGKPPADNLKKILPGTSPYRVSDEDLHKMRLPEGDVPSAPSDKSKGIWLERGTNPYKLSDEDMERLTSTDQNLTRNESSGDVDRVMQEYGSDYQVLEHNLKLFRDINGYVNKIGKSEFEINKDPKNGLIIRFNLFCA